MTPTLSARLPFYYGWVNVVIAAILTVTTIAGNDQGLGLITESLIKDVQIDRVHWSTINLWATLIATPFVYPTGKLIDRFGSRIVLTAILVPLGLAVIAMSHATSTGHLWVTAILTNILGQSALSVAGMTLVGKWFGRRISLAMGVFSILVVIGYVFVFLYFGPAIARYGWREVWQYFGWVILVGLAPLSWLLVRSTPQTIGHPGDDVNQAHAPVSGMTCGAALSTQAFWFFAISSAFFGVLIGGIMLFYESILRERGFDSHVRDTVLSIQMVVGLVVSFIGGWAGLRWSLAKIQGFALLLLAGSLILLANLSSMTEVILYALAMGASGALITVIFFSVWGHAFGSAHLGQIQGVAKGICMISGAFGPRILAQVQESTGSYAPAFYAFAALCVALGIWAWLVPIPQRAPQPS